MVKHLWAPWRMSYLQFKDEQCSDCIFCVADKNDEDSERLVLHRGRLAFVMMNKFPYTNGHLLISPYRHIADIADVEDEEMLEMHQLLKLSRKVLDKYCKPQGFNIGMNIGPVAGAGIADHLHLHLVPRWAGDTNFMPVFAEVRVIPQHLQETYRLLSQCFADLQREGCE